MREKITSFGGVWPWPVVVVVWGGVLGAMWLLAYGVFLRDDWHQMQEAIQVTEKTLATFAVSFVSEAQRVQYQRQIVEMTKRLQQLLEKHHWNQSHATLLAEIAHLAEKVGVVCDLYSTSAEAVEKGHLFSVKLTGHYAQLLTFLQDLVGMQSLVRPGDFKIEKSTFRAGDLDMTIRLYMEADHT